MIPVKQDVLYAEDGIGNGSCLAACLASLLELPLWLVPPFHLMFGRSDWNERIDDWLGRIHGMKRIRTQGHVVEKLPEFYIASGMSARGVMHAVIYRAGELAHDPHPSGTGIASVESTTHLEPAPAALRRKANYVGAPAIFALEAACREINDSFGGFGCYLVGSAIERPDWRDVDVRMILEDEAFAALFPTAHPNGAWEFDPRWLLLTVAISERLQRITGLPVDFQFQPQSWANERHKKPRHPIGMRMAPKVYAA